MKQLRLSLILILLLFMLFSPYLGFVKGDPSPGPGAILRVSLPAGENRTNISDPDPWLSQCWLLNITGVSATFTLRINNTSGNITSYDTHLIIALNNASYDYLLNLTVDTTTIDTFSYGTPKPYNFWNWPSGDVYPTWFNDTYVMGTIGPKNYTDVTVSVTFSNATGVRMHFEAYGSKVSPPPPTVPGEITHNPLSGDSTVLFQPSVQYYLTVKTDPPGLSPAPTPSSNWYDNCTYVNLTAPEYANVSASTRYRFDHWTVDNVTYYTQNITVHMDTNKTATAHYIIQYYLTVVTNPPGVDAPTGEDWYDNSTYAPISTAMYDDIVPGESRYKFNGWTTTDMAEITIPSSTSTTVHMDKPKTVTANYVVEYIERPGGYATPIDIVIGKEASHLLASQIGLALTLIAATAVTITLIRRRKKIS